MLDCNEYMSNIEHYMVLKKYSRILDEFPDKEKFPFYYRARKHEFTINEGEMLLIPAGWFHFVFSEDANIDSGLNFAMNFWYDPENNWRDGHISGILPRVEKHELSHLTPRDIFKSDEKMHCVYSKLNGLFPSNRTFSQFPRMCHGECMTFDEFYETKNPRYYIIQQETDAIKKYAPKYPTKLFKYAAWVNFGNVRSLIHYDEQDNWLCQIQGKRRVILFPPEDRIYLYMFNDMPMDKCNSVGRLVDDHRHFIGLYTNKLNNEMCSKYSSLSGLVDDEILHDAYKKTIIEYYNGKLYSLGINMNQPPIPEDFKIFHSHLILDGICTKYPIVMIMAVKGNGAVSIHGYKDFLLNAGDIICFPNHFTYVYNIRGYLKIICPN